MDEELPGIEELVRSVEAQTGADLERVRVAVELADELGARGDAVVTHFVEAARAAGCSWSQIGGQLGVSKQAAQQAFVAAGPHRGPGSGRRRGRFGRGPGLGGGVGGRPGHPGEGPVRPFERFSGGARAVVARARLEAVTMGHGHIGTEHLLLGLLDQAEGVAATALGERGMQAEAVRGRITEHVPPRRGGGMRVPVGPRAKKVFAMAALEAGSRGERVGTGHLLLALLNEGEGLAAQVLVELGVDLGAMRARVVELLRTPDGPHTPGGPRTD